MGIKAKAVIRHVDQPYMLFSRSSISKTPLGLANPPGLIDPEYKGEVKEAFDNNTDKDHTINVGTKLVQIVSFHGGPIDIQIVDELDTTTRGDGGFGSTDTLIDNPTKASDVAEGALFGQQRGAEEALFGQQNPSNEVRGACVSPPVNRFPVASLTGGDTPQGSINCQPIFGYQKISCHTSGNCYHPDLSNTSVAHGAPGQDFRDDASGQDFHDDAWQYQPRRAVTSSSNGDDYPKIGIDVGGVINRFDPDNSRNDAWINDKSVCRKYVILSIHSIVQHFGAINVYIISKRGPEMQKRARHWLSSTLDTCKETELLADHVLFCIQRTGKHGKDELIKQLGITHSLTIEMKF